MKSTEGRNNVKVYNLSAGKSLPEWLTDRKRRQLSKRNLEFRRRIELIQDFTMPDVSGCIKVSADGRYILATGSYKPRVKCFEMSALSLKFERCFDADVVQFEILSEDYSKLVFLQEERYVEFHSQAGRWFRTRIPKFGRDLAYHYPSCDLYIAASGSQIYRLNLSQGRFMTPLQTDSIGINKCLFNQAHYLLTCGTEDGRIETWDPRSRHRVGVLDCAIHMTSENLESYGFKSAKSLGITSLAYHDSLTLGVGTQTGQVLLYDIRACKPLLVKDHMDGLPIRNLEFHPSSGMVLSMSPKMVKVWEKQTGAPHTSIESEVDFNDLCVVPDSGMLFMATEDIKMQTYFLPSLGPAPRWCSHLDALIEELEEEDVAELYDDYCFVTTQELDQLGLGDLIGTNALRAAMHGYYIDARLYKKAKLIANPFDFNDFMKRRLKQKITETNERGIAAKKLPNVNRDLFTRLLEDEADPKAKTRVTAASLLKDDRFSSLFAADDFQIDKDSEEFKLVNPVMSRMDKKKQKAKLHEEEEEQEYLHAQGLIESSDSDSIMSADEDDDEPMEEFKEKVKTKDKVKHMVPTSGTSKAQPPLSSELNFTAANSLDDLKSNRKRLNKLSLAERLAMETSESEEVRQHSFGSREMSYQIRKPARFERLRQQQEQHHEERRKVRRSTVRLRGNLRMKDPMV